MLKNLYQLISEAQDYAEAYARQYAITDPDLLKAIYVTHLAYLLNEK